MHHAIRWVLTGLMLLPMGSVNSQQPDLELIRQQVEGTERSFARTMADRDFEAFLSYLSPETVFFSGDSPLRGRQAVADAWKPYFEEPDAPFSWAPELVVVLDSGTLALSSGPVYDPGGTRVATFNSIWRSDPDGRWRIVFDKGSPECAEAPLPGGQ